MKFSGTEIRHLLIAWLAISLAFTFLFSRRTILRGVYEQFPLVFVVSLLTVGISFVIHEMLHKFLAQKYGLWAEFRMDISMLLFAILLSITVGIVYAVPGAVYISGQLTKEQNGKISLAGPLSNIVLAWMFLLLLPGTGIWRIISVTGSTVNAMFAIFNLLPFGILDGKKVFVWDRKIYLITMITAILTMFMVYVN